MTTRILRLWPCLAALLLAVLMAAVPTLAAPPAGSIQSHTARMKPAGFPVVVRVPLLVPSQYPTIQAAVNASHDGDTVLVADGTYTGPGNRDIDFHGKNITVTSQNGPAKTIIDCGGYKSTDGSGNHRGFYLHSGEKSATISGFTVKNGYETYISSIPDSDLGGGIYSHFKGNGNATITLTNCIISGNTAGGGGGVYNSNYKGNATLTNCTITGNTSPYGGGLLIQNDNGTTTLINCTITGNTAQDGTGGGVYNENGSGTITLTNCTISENTAAGGGGVYNVNSTGTTTLNNCSITTNTASDGGGIYNRNYSNGSTTTLTNDIIYGNTGSVILLNNYGIVAASFSDIQGGYPGTGNIDADPQFVNAAAGDLHLKPGSPCLDAGTPNGAPATDLDGKTRPNPPSMGAYELGIVPAAIQSFTITPNHVDAPGPKVFADVAVTGNFKSVRITCAPGSLNGLPPTFVLTPGSGHWTASLPTAFLKLAKVNPLTLIATGVRSDGSLAQATATLRVGPLPTLTLAVSSDKSAVPAGQTFSVKGFVRNLTTTIATPVTVTIPLPTYLSFVSSPDFTFNAAENTVTWTGPLGANNGSHTISVEFKASANTPTNKQIAINVTASAPDFQSITQSASIVVGAPPVPLGVDIDSSGAAGQADGTAIITSNVGTAPLLAVISPVSGLGHAWLGVDHAYDASGGQLAPTTDASVGSLAAKEDVIGPGVSPTYSASFPRIGSQCNIGLRLTDKSAMLNITSILYTAIIGSLGPKPGDSAEIFEFYAEFKKVRAFQDAANQLAHPATTPWERAFQTAYIIQDFLNVNPNDLDTLAIYLSGKLGRVITAGGIKTILKAFGRGRAILQIG